MKTRSNQEFVQGVKKTIDDAGDLLSTLKSKCKLSPLEAELVDRTVEEIRELSWKVIENDTELQSLRSLIAEVVKRLFCFLRGLFG